MQRSVIDGSSPRAPCRPSAVAALSRTMKKSLGALLVVVVILAAIVLERTFTFRSRQPQAGPVAVGPLDTAALAQRLAGALRFKTISFQDSSQFDAREFDGLHQYLRTTFPKLHAALKLEKVNGYGLLYEWTGSDPGLAPIVLLAHQDVVPGEPGTEGRWTEPAFEGKIAAGYVWGRGALEDKGRLVALLEAIAPLGESREARRRARRDGDRRAVGGAVRRQVRRDAAGQRDAPAHDRAGGLAGGGEAERPAVVRARAGEPPQPPGRQCGQRARARAAGGAR